MPFLVTTKPATLCRFNGDGRRGFSDSHAMNNDGLVCHDAGWPHRFYSLGVAGQVSKE